MATYERKKPHVNIGMISHFAPLFFLGICADLLFFFFTYIRQGPLDMSITERLVVNAIGCLMSCKFSDIL